MAGAYKRPSDKKRGSAGKYTGWYYKADKTRAYFAGTADKATTIRMAQAREAEAKLVRQGLIDSRDVAARDAAADPLTKHIRDYRKELISRGDKPKHVKHTIGVLERLFSDAGIASIGSITQDQIRSAIGRLTVKRGGDFAKASARTKNHAQTSVRGFTRWLTEGANRLKEDPLGSMRKRYDEKADIRYWRRDLSLLDLGRLLEAATNGVSLVARRPLKSRHLEIRISGPDRAMAYRIAMGTGFRASEIRSLTPESFQFGAEPTITVEPAYTKNKKKAIQPIRGDLAEILKPWLKDKEPDEPVLILPEKTAKMLRVDLATAGIPYETKDGVVDFHALRTSYITILASKETNLKTLQEMARHSTVTLTIERYVKTNDTRKRQAIENVGSPEPPRSANEDS